MVDVVSKESCSNFTLGSLDSQFILIQNRLALPSVNVPSVFKVPYVGSAPISMVCIKSNTYIPCHQP